MKSPQPEESKPPAKMEQRGRILGIGGVFFKSANRDQMREWYSKHLGLADKGHGAMLPWREHDDPTRPECRVKRKGMDYILISIAVWIFYLA
ncbi:MAG: hypothetical protein ACLQVL_00425, partial [Terriglobia bacterium]